MVGLTSNEVGVRNSRLRITADFLADYVCELLAAGATSARTEMNIARIAAHYGVEVDLAILTKHVILTVTVPESGETLSSVHKVPGRSISFYRNTALSKLSWQVCDESLTLEQVRPLFVEIVRRRDNNPWVVNVLTSFANLAFCEIFGGDVYAMGVVFVATLVGYSVKIELLRRGMDTRAVFIISAFCATIIGSACYVYHLGSTPEVALGTCVLYLVPGIPFINSIADLIYGHNMCFLSRLIHASVLTICLSMGFILGLLVMRINILN